MTEEELKARPDEIAIERGWTSPKNYLLLDFPKETLVKYFLLAYPKLEEDGTDS